jgi:hypothetical protein
VVGDNYFAGYFDVYVPDALSDTEGRRSIVTMVVEIAVVAAIAAVTALFYGGIL